MPLMLSAADLIRQSLYVCRPEGAVAIQCTSPASATTLLEHGFVRVVFKPVQCRYVCSVNGDDAEWIAQLPHRPDGQRLTY
jgi:hypothetical protein